MPDKKVKSKFPTEKELADSVKTTANDEERQAALGKLVDFIYDTPENRLSELTDLSVDQPRPLSFMEIYEREVENLVSMIEDSQNALNKLITQYEGLDIAETETERDEIIARLDNIGFDCRVEEKEEKVEGKRKPQKVYYIWFKRQPIDIKIDFDYKLDDKEKKLLMTRWRISYYKHLRSKNNDHRIAAVTLAQDQIQASAGAESAQDILDRIHQQ